jgi:hypothetical protein
MRSPGSSSRTGISGRSRGSWTKTCWRSAWLCCFTLAAVGTADAVPTIGEVTRIQGACQGRVDGASKNLASGAVVFANELIATGPAARLEITLTDETVLTLGENATLTLDAFVFKPGETENLHAAVTGAFRFVSGKLAAAAATRDASVKTPFATIGIRGTNFWGGPIDGRFGVVLLEGRVTVSHRGRSTTLRHSHEGVDLDGLAAPPGPVKAWAAAKINRAIATVTFR